MRPIRRSPFRGERRPYAPFRGLAESRPVPSAHALGYSLAPSGLPSVQIKLLEEHLPMTKTLLRVSVGIEDLDDIIADFAQALG